MDWIERENDEHDNKKQQTPFMRIFYSNFMAPLLQHLPHSGGDFQHITQLYHISLGQGPVKS